MMSEAVMEHLDTGVLERCDFGGAVVLDLQHHGAIVDHRNPAALASECGEVTMPFGASVAGRPVCISAMRSS